jgi:hypothetical protein
MSASAETAARTLLRRSTLLLHAPNASVLRDLVVSDLERRISELEHRAKGTRSAVEGAKIAYVLAELRMMQQYWQDISITGGRTRERN